MRRWPQALVVGLQGLHARGDEKGGRVVRRHQRRALQHEVVPVLEVAQETSSDLVSGHRIWHSLEPGGREAPTAAYSGPSDSRRCSSAARWSRETCIWLMPSRLATSDWDISSKNRMIMIRRSRSFRC